MPNIWHPAVRDLYARNVEALGRLIRAGLFPIAPLGADDVGTRALGGFTDVWGYNQGAIAAFRSG